MNLKCRINNIEYNISQGVPFSDEYNETLDSATIIIPHTKGKIADLKPYTDVYIYDNDYVPIPLKYGTYEALNEPLKFTVDKIEADGLLIYYKWQGNFRDDFLDYYTAINPSTDIQEKVIELNVEWDDGEKSKYRYKLQKKNGEFILDAVDIFPIPLSIVYDNNGNQFIEADFRDFGRPKTIEITANLDWYAKPIERGFYKHYLVNDYSSNIINIQDNIYKYTISLFSETKGLETIILPNETITPPLNINKARTVWEYLNDYVEMYSPLIKTVKYVSMETNEWIYRKKYSLSPKLKSIFNNVYSPENQFNTPTLRDLLTSLMLTKDRIPVVRDNVIDCIDLSATNGEFNVIQDNIIDIQGSASSGNHVDKLKRNYSNALSQDYSARLTQYIGFRNSENALMTFDNLRLEFAFPINKINKILMCYYKKINIVKPDGNGKEVIFLCKQDITPLVVLNSKRNVLNDNWKEFLAFKPSESTLEEFAKFKLSTVGYDIGSNFITGWGTKYTYLESEVSWFEKSATYLQNILKILDQVRPTGIYEIGFFIKQAGAERIEYTQTDFGFDAIYHPDVEGVAKLKFVFFEVDYDAFYNGATEVTKDYTNEDTITAIDNTSSSLAMLEKDGLFLKSKVNRFGNEAIVISCRHDNINELQELGTVYDDYIIYHREYSIFDTEVMAVYYATKNFVLKNYYTSVFSKIRPFSLASYQESVTRADNKKSYLLISKDKKYFENQETNNGLVFKDFSKSVIKTLASAFIESKRPISLNVYDYPDKINYGIIEYNGEKYACDVNVFVNGKSLCFNLKPYDNVSAGVYIEDAMPFDKLLDVNVDDAYTGTKQNWYRTVDDIETGFTKEMGFYVGHNEQGILGDNLIVSESDVKSNYEKLFALPKLTEQTLTNAIGKVYTINKDSKTAIDMTFQIEPIVDNDEIVITPMFMKLCDLVSNYQKNSAPFQLQENAGNDADLQWFNGTYYSHYMSIGGSGAVVESKRMYPLFCFSATKDRIDTIKQAIKNFGKYETNIIWDYSYIEPTKTGFSQKAKYYNFTVKSIDELTDEYILITGEERYKIRYFTQEIARERRFKLKRVTTLGIDANNYPIQLLPIDRQWFVNADFDIQDLNSPVGKEIIFYPEINKLTYENAVGKENDIDWNLLPQKNLKIDISFDIENKIFLPNEENSNVTNAGGGYIGVSKEFPENMFVVLSENPVENTIVSDELKSINDSAFDVQSTFEFTDDENIKIDIESIDNADGVEKDYKSIQYWFFDEKSNSYKLVFGVNITDEDKERGYILIKLSLIYSRDKRVYGITQDIVGEIANYDGTLPYGEKQYFKEL